MPINDDKLVEYVLGVLEDDERTAIETELASSASLRARITRLYDTLATPALATQPVEPAGNLDARIQESVAHPDRFHGFLDRLTVFLDLPEPRVRELLDGIERAAGEWAPSELPGVRMRRFEGGPRLSGSECALLWIGPGGSFPRHEHLGHEWGFVLQGEAEEDSGKVYKPGDIVHKPPGSTHLFTARSDAPFVSFVVYNGISFG